MSGANSWLARQRKSDLVELADRVGLRDYEALRKSELELQLDEFLSDNASQFQSDPKFASYYTSRARTAGSPVKKDPELRVARRRGTKAADEIVAADDDEESSSGPTSATTALIQTPGRALSLASRIPLPATPADVAHAVDRGTVAVRERVSSLYQESGITERTQATRELLSTVQAIQFLTAAFELYYLRPELIPNRYAFTIPAIKAIPGLGSDIAVHLPDLFYLLTSSFWYPALTWAFTSFLAPAFFGYFFNLSAGNSTTGGGRHRAGYTEYVIDPLTFSIVKGLVTYVVFAQGVTFGGWISADAVSRINLALYSGWQGSLVGSAVAALAAVYDAALKK